MRRLVAFWLGFWAALGCFFWVMDRRDRALCKATRHLFRTHDPRGRLALVAFVEGGAVVLIRHLLKVPRPPS